jgi:hypothetical protein
MACPFAVWIGERKKEEVKESAQTRAKKKLCETSVRKEKERGDALSNTYPT